MPKVFEINGYKFFFYSNEGNPRERCHIHVRKSGNDAKFWLSPNIAIADSWGFSGKELNEIEKTVLENKDLIEEKWNEYFN
ncbi:MAG: DUF4160 domain-containing protein [Spirochaetaceae bacterium]|jgi:hypothetical protein|nr:DUF4160 domain-containing protein [Spirochaetaceae bacterium]